MSCIYYSIYFKIILFIINSFYDNEPNLTNLLKKSTSISYLRSDRNAKHRRQYCINIKVHVHLHVID